MKSTKAQLYIRRSFVSALLAGAALCLAAPVVSASVTKPPPPAPRGAQAGAQDPRAPHVATDITHSHAGMPGAMATASPENAQIDETGTGNAEAEHEEGGPKPINFSDTSNKKQPPYIAALLNFLILAGIYWYFGKGPVAKGLIARRDTIQKQIEEAQRMKEEAQERAKEYQAKLAGLDAELASTKAAMVDAGKNERDRIVKEAEEKAARMTRDAQFLIEQELKTTMDTLRKQTIESAIAAAEEILKKGMTTDDQMRLADEYITELAAKASARNSTRPSSAGGAS